MKRFLIALAVFLFAFNGAKAQNSPCDGKSCVIEQSTSRVMIKDLSLNNRILELRVGNDGYDAANFILAVTVHVKASWDGEGGYWGEKSKDYTVIFSEFAPAGQDREYTRTVPVRKSDFPDHYYVSSIEIADCIFKKGTKCE